MTEWVEIYNTSPNAVDLTDWTLSDEDGVPFGGPIAGKLDPGEVGIITPVSEADFKAAWPTATNAKIFTTAWSTDEALGNTPSSTDEILQLLDDTANVVDEVNYQEGGDWPRAGGSESIYLKRDHVDWRLNDFGASWWEAKDGLDGGIVATETAIFNRADVGSPGIVNPFERVNKTFTHDFNVVADWTDNFAPTNYNVPGGSRFEWAGGELQVPAGSTDGEHAFTYTAEEFPLPRVGDRLTVSIDFTLDTNDVLVLSKALHVFVSRSSSGDGVFTGTQNGNANIELEGTYGGSPADGFRVLLNVEPDGNNTMVSSPELQFPVDAAYDLNLKVDFIGVAGDRLKVSATLSGQGLAAPVSLTATDNMSTFSLSDPTWQVGIHENSESIASVDNFEIEYAPSFLTFPVVSTPAAGMLNLTWNTSAALMVDIYRSKDMVTWVLEAANQVGGSYTVNFIPIDSPNFFVIVPAGAPPP